MPASPLVEARHGANPFVQLPPGTPFPATAGTALAIRLVDTAGVTTWDLQCISTDETSTLLTVTRDAPPAFSATVTPQAGAGRTYIFRSRVNGGNGPNGQPDPALTYTFAVEVPAANGYPVVAANESFESDGLYGWASKVNNAIRISGLTAMPVGTGVVTTAGGTGSVLAYGAAYRFLRMNAAGTAVEFSDGVQSDGGLEMGTGLKIKFPIYAGLALVNGGAGLIVKADGTKGIALSNDGVGVSLAATPGLEFSGGLKAKVNTASMVLDASGIGADLTKVAGLSGGRLNASQRVGWQVAAPPTVLGVPASITSTTLVSQGIMDAGVNVAVGDVVDVDFQVGLNAGLSGNYNTEFTLRTASTARVTDSIYVGERNTSWKQRYIVAVAGALSAQIRMAKVAAEATTTPNTIRAIFTVTRPNP